MSAMETELMARQANWRLHAACCGVDPELFFPVGVTGPALLEILKAKRICRICPVRTPCLAWALDHKVTDGVWGGTTEEERRALRKRHRADHAGTMVAKGEGHDQ
jgi:WhiB family transcriptional regulator, redox-sensing transcriptional regulator